MKGSFFSDISIGWQLADKYNQTEILSGVRNEIVDYCLHEHSLDISEYFLINSGDLTDIEKTQNRENIRHVNDVARLIDGFRNGLNPFSGAKEPYTSYRPISVEKAFFCSQAKADKFLKLSIYS